MVASSSELSDRALGLGETEQFAQPSLALLGRIARLGDCNPASWK